MNLLKKTRYILIALATTAFVLGVSTESQSAAPSTVTISGGSAGDPTDITSYLIAQENVVLDGGYFVVNLPQNGVGVVTSTDANPLLSYNGGTRSGAVGFDSPTDPTVVYNGVISGSGTIKVQSAFAPTQPSLSGLFTGGALVFTNQNGQTWGNGPVPTTGLAAPALTIGPNATVAFTFPGSRDSPVTTAGNNGSPLGSVFPASATISRNIENDGFLYSSAANNWASITGTGVAAFTEWGGDDGGFTQGNTYSAANFIFENGFEIHQQTSFVDQPNGNPTLVTGADIIVYVNGNRQYILDPSTYKVGDPVMLLTSDITMWALDFQFFFNGINQFAGVLLTPAGSASYLNPAPRLEAVKAVYSYGTGADNGFGRNFDVIGGTSFLMGNGQQVVTNADGITNNVFMQGNPYNTEITFNDFGPSTPQGIDNEAIAYAYSGTYHINHALNQALNNYEITGIRGTDWVNFALLNPNDWNPNASLPNHAIVTVPVFLAGITAVQPNSILQLGDGTVGNDVAAKTLTVNGSSFTSRYNDSFGNGTLMTKGNYAMLTGSATMNSAVNFQIVDNGQIIVDNTPNALSMTVSSGTTPGVSTEVAAWVSLNELDGISGTGSVEQRGALTLNLGSAAGNPNSYTGGTTVDANSSLEVGSSTALGARNSAAPTGTGNVSNKGIIFATSSVQSINVPGDYSQNP